jgi:enoyl-CoA hydratase
MPGSVAIEQIERVTVVTIHRPERRNAVDLATAEALYSAFQAFDRNESSDVAVLTGAGGVFCAGADLHAIAAESRGELRLDGAEGEQRPLSEASDFGPMGPTRLRLSKPVIAAIEGYCVAGGLEVALWCDLRVAGRSAVLGVFNRRFGVPLIDMGTIRLPRLIGQARALDLMLTGRAVAAEEALAIGLVSRVVEDGAALPEALALAMQLCAFPQTAMRNDRLSALEQWGMRDDPAIANEMRHGLSTLASGEAVAGAKRFSGGEGRKGKH